MIFWNLPNWVIYYIHSRELKTSPYKQVTSLLLSTHCLILPQSLFLPLVLFCLQYPMREERIIPSKVCASGSLGFATWSLVVLVLYFAFSILCGRLCLSITAFALDFYPCRFSHSFPAKCPTPVKLLPWPDYLLPLVLIYFAFEVFYAGESYFLPSYLSISHGEHLTSLANFSSIAGSPSFSPQYLMQGEEYYVLRFTNLVFRFSYFEPLGFLCSQLPVYTPSSIIITKYLNSSHKQADTKEFSLIYTTAPLSPYFSYMVLGFFTNAGQEVRMAILMQGKKHQKTSC